MADQKPSKASQATSTATDIAVKQGTKKAATAIGTKAAATFASSRVAATAVGTAIAPGIGTVVANVATTAAIAAKKYGGKAVAALTTGLLVAGSFLTAGFVAVVGAGLTAAGAIAGVSLIVVPIIVAFILFIINSGAYVTPFGSLFGGPGGSGDFPTIEVGANCPIPGGRVLWGSYGGPFSDIGHGENGYWNSPSVNAHCSAYDIPENTGCFSKQPGDQCYGETGNSCSYYGYASDFIYPDVQRNGQPVFYPYINGESVDWTLGDCRSGSSSVCLIRAVQGESVYEMRTIHLLSRPRGGRSGDLLGEIYTTRGTPHIHVELRVDGQWVPPEFMCEGGASGGEEPVPPEEPLPVCASIGGTCISTPNCSRSNRTQLEGSCGTNPSLLCCSTRINPPAANSCTTAGGRCWDPIQLGVLNPEGPLVPTTCEESGETSVAGTCENNFLCCAQ